MAIDTIHMLHPKLALPVYTKIIGPRFNSYTVGNIYEMRLSDEERAKERGQKPPFNYVHDSLLIAKEKMALEDVPDILLAFDKNTQMKDEAMNATFDNKGEVLVLVFLRLDKAKDFVMEGLEAVHKEFDKYSLEEGS